MRTSCAMDLQRNSVGFCSTVVLVVVILSLLRKTDEKKKKNLRRRRAFYPTRKKKIQLQARRPPTQLQESLSIVVPTNNVLIAGSLVLPLAGPYFEFFKLRQEKKLVIQQPLENGVSNRTTNRSIPNNKTMLAQLK